MQTEVKQTDNCHENKVWSTVLPAGQSLLSYCSFHPFTCTAEGRRLHRCWHITLFMVEGRRLHRCWHLCISHAFSCDLIIFSRFSLEPGFSLLSYLILLFVFLTNNYQTFISLQYTLDITTRTVQSYQPFFPILSFSLTFAHSSTYASPWSNSFQKITKELPCTLVLTGLPWK